MAVWMEGPFADGRFWFVEACFGRRSSNQHLFSRKSEESKSILSELKKWLWIDRGTRAVLIDFTVYNANINLFCIIQLMAEFPATGGVMTSSQFKTVKLLHLKGSNYKILLLKHPKMRILHLPFILDNFDYFILGTEIVYMLYILYYTGKDLASELN